MYIYAIIVTNTDQICEPTLRMNHSNTLFHDNLKTNMID